MTKRGLCGQRQKCSFDTILVGLLILVGSTQVLSIRVTDDARAPSEIGQYGADISASKGFLTDFNSLSGYFIENKGQVSSTVRFYHQGNPSVAFRDDGVMFLIRGRTESIFQSESRGILDDEGTENERVRTDFLAYMVRFDGSNNAMPVGRERLPFDSNFFEGNDSSQWQTDVPNYREILYPNLYDGIDLVYHLDSRGVKYEFIVGAGASLSDIRMKYEGADSVDVTDESLAINTALGTVRDSIPLSYQGVSEPVSCRPLMRGPYTQGFDCAEYDPSRPLIIDPLVYSTFIGGSDDNQWCGIEQGDRGYSIAVDPTGSAYIYGGTCSTDFPVTPGAFNRTYWIQGAPQYVQPDCGSPGYCPMGEWCVDPRQAFVAKLNPEGNMLVYATYLGGVNLEQATSIAVDSAGNAYVTGMTLSAGLQPGTKPYPTTPGAFDTDFGIYLRRTGPAWCCSLVFAEAYITKLNPLGNGLVYSTFLGGVHEEWSYSIAIDSMGNAYVAGETNGTDFPVTPGAFDTTFNSNMGTWDYPDAFIAKLNPSGSVLVYATYIGGIGYEWAQDIAVDSSGNAYITGETNSSNFPVTPGSIDTTIGRYLDGFVLKLNAGGSALAYSTFLGGNDIDLSMSIDVDISGNAYVTGMTNSTDFPITPGVFDPFMFNREAFISKLNPTGSSFVYSTFLGGDSATERGNGIAVDSFGNAYVTGFTYSANFPLTADAFDTVLSGREGFFSKINPTATSVLYSSYMGGRGDNDQGSSVVVDTLGIAYITGWANSSDFPVTPGAYDTSFDNVTDAFVVKWNPVTPADPPDIVIQPLGIIFNPASPAWLNDPVSISAIVRNVGGTNVSDVVVRFFDGPPGGTNQIGSDRIVPFIERYFGEGLAFVTWTASPIGAHEIYVVVDPDNAIQENREDNNEAHAPIEVLPLKSDLAIAPADITLTPPPPYQPATSVQVQAVVRNVGKAASTATVVRFHDGIPPSPVIGSDQAIAPLAVGGSASVSVMWTASPSGDHSICAVADPGNIVIEMDETNNMACKAAKVLTPPDLVPTAISVAPSSPITFGMNTWVNVTIQNWGDIDAGVFDLVLFDDSNSNRIPEAGETISVAAQPGLPGRFQIVIEFRWIASPEGAHSICANADPPPGTVTESNENNNVACTPVAVQPGPALRPDYMPVQPQPSTTVITGPSTSVLLSISVQNQGNDTTSDAATVTFYVPPSTPFDSFVLSPLSPSETSSPFVATWISPPVAGTYQVCVDVDYFDDVIELNETNNVYTWTIYVVESPITSLVVGSPNYTSTVTYVTSSTPLDFSVLDQSGTGIRHTNYSIDGSVWNDYTVTGTFHLPWEGEHTVEWYSEDFAGNVENISSTVLRIDDTPPATTHSIGDPKHQAAHLFVKSTTAIILTSVDGGITPVGLAAMEYKIDGGNWVPYSPDITMTGSDGLHTVYYISRDLLDNEEVEGSLVLFLDETPPATSISPATGRFDTTTLFTLAATDGGSGVKVTRYRIDSGLWTDYSVGFTLAEGNHTVYFYSKDNLDNTEEEKWLVVTVEEGTPTPPEVAVNYKPIVAFVFAIILLVAGVWSSRRRPWKGGNDRMAVVKAFLAFPLPFMLAELATGVASFVTGHLAVPPVLGLGTIVDIVILASGLIITAVRGLGRIGLGLSRLPA